MAISPNFHPSNVGHVHRLSGGLSFPAYLFWGFYKDTVVSVIVQFRVWYDHGTGQDIPEVQWPGIGAPSVPLSRCQTGQQANDFVILLDFPQSVYEFEDIGGSPPASRDPFTVAILEVRRGSVREESGWQS